MIKSALGQEIKRTFMYVTDSQSLECDANCDELFKSNMLIDSVVNR